MDQQDDLRNDLHLTSTGVGHIFMKPLKFPPLQKRNVHKDFPPLVQQGENDVDIYMTSTNAAHNYKHNNTVLSNEIYKKSPGHWGVHYTQDTARKLEAHPQREPLTMGNQFSEMKSQFAGRPEVPLASSNYQPPTYKHHLTDGPLKKLRASAQNAQLCGQKFYTQDKDVLKCHGDPYLTTIQKDHRQFKREELNGYPKKEYTTYWECENYPKAWGHGSIDPPSLAFIPRDRGAMRDPTMFKTATVIPRIPKKLQPVPNGGLVSEMKANFCDISNEDRSQVFKKSVETPWQLKNAGKEEIFSVPRMYQTDYQTVGGNRPVFV